MSILPPECFSSPPYATVKLHWIQILITLLVAVIWWNIALELYYLSSVF